MLGYNIWQQILTKCTYIRSYAHENMLAVAHLGDHQQLHLCIFYKSIKFAIVLL